jgi:hypothetical protein
LLPFILIGFSRSGYQMWTGRRLAPLAYWPRWGTKALLWLFLAYWVARNVPCEPFTWLAPHKLEGPEERIAHHAQANRAR